MRTINYLTVFATIILASVSCGKIQTLAPEPNIKYTSFTVFDTVDILGNSAKGGRLEFYFEDGDGDLGLPTPTPGQTFDSINLFFSLYRETGGVLSPAPDNDPLKPSGYRIPYMERLGQNKLLKGTIKVTFLYLFYSESDSIKYDFHIKDRADNESNTASTAVIPLYLNGVYKN